MNCPICGNELSVTALMCDKCGSRIESVSKLVHPSIPGTEQDAPATTNVIDNSDPTPIAAPMGDLYAQSSGTHQVERSVSRQYATLASLSLTSVLAAAVTAFMLADGAARGHLNSSPLCVIFPFLRL